MPRLKVTHPNSERTEYEFGEHAVTIGREADNLVVIDVGDVSRHHAVLEFVENVWWLQDLGSANGTFSGGAKVCRIKLQDRTSFEIGGHKLRFTLGEAKAARGERKVGKAETSATGQAATEKRKKRGKKNSGKKTPANSISNQAPSPPLATPGLIEDTTLVCEDASQTDIPDQAETAAGAAERPCMDEASAKAEEPVVKRGAPIVAVPSESAPASTWRLGGLKIAALVVVGLTVSGLWLKQKHSGRDQPKVDVADASPPSTPAPAIVKEPEKRRPEAKKDYPVVPPQVTRADDASEPLPPAKVSMRIADTPDTPLPVRSAAALPPKNSTEPSTVPVRPSHPGGGRKAEEERLIIYRATAGGAGFQPVISPRLDRVLHIKKAEAGAGWLDVFLNDKPILRNAKVRGESDLHFSSDGSGWAVAAVDDKGAKIIVLQDRVIRFEGDLRQFVGNTDFSVVATVTRSGGEDHLSINGLIQSSYHHMRELQLSQDGKKWAYVAVRSPESRFSAEPAGERVVTSEGPLEVVDQVRDLHLAQDGSRVVWTAADRSGAQRLMSGSQLVHQLSAFDQSEIQSVTLSHGGDRLAWAVVPSRRAPPVFYLDGTQRFTADVFGGEGTKIESSLRRRDRPLTRIVFSRDGKLVMYAASGDHSVIRWEGGRLTRHPFVLLDSITVSSEGSRVAYVALKPSDAASPQAMQMHESTLWVDDQQVVTRDGVWVRGMGNDSNLILGGISGVRFSPNGSRVACIMSTVRTGAEATLKQLMVDGRVISAGDQDVTDSNWLDDHRLVLLNTPSDTDSVERVVIKADQAEKPVD